MITHEPVDGLPFQVVADLKREGKLASGRLAPEDLQDMVIGIEGAGSNGRLYPDDLCKVVRLAGIRG